MSVQLPDVGTKPARDQPIAPNIGVTACLKMLAHSTRPDKWPNSARNPASV